MDIKPINRFGIKTRIDPQNARQHLKGVILNQGSQILRVPPGSTIRNIVLNGGASFGSKWAVLRGAVLKFDPKREPVVINGQGFEVPSGHTLMDYPSYLFTRNNKNSGQEIPHRIIDGISSERFYLVHASYCHPDQLFLPQGAYAMTTFYAHAPYPVKHLELKDGVFYLKEEDILGKGPFNILEGLDRKPQRIIVQLVEGGLMSLA